MKLRRRPIANRGIADEARNKQHEHENDAKNERDAQKDAADRVPPGTILDAGLGGSTPVTEMTEAQLQEKKRNAQVYIYNQDLNFEPGNLTAQQEWGRHGKLAEIAEVDAELARRDADAKQAEADAAQRAADEAKNCVTMVQQAGNTAVATAQNAVNAAAAAVATAAGQHQAAVTALNNAKSALTQAVTDAANSAKDNLMKAKKDAMKELEAAKEKMRQMISDVTKALYFAKQLGLTPDSLDLDAWKAEMDKLTEAV